jgi:hypothetical protein
MLKQSTAKCERIASGRDDFTLLVKGDQSYGRHASLEKSFEAFNSAHNQNKVLKSRMNWGENHPVHITQEVPWCGRH